MPPFTRADPVRLRHNARMARAADGMVLLTPDEAGALACELLALRAYRAHVQGEPRDEPAPVGA